MKYQLSIKLDLTINVNNLRKNTIISNNTSFCFINLFITLYYKHKYKIY